MIQTEMTTEKTSEKTSESRAQCADAADILTALLSISPVPKDSPSVRAVWLRDTAAAVKTLLKVIDLEFRIAVDDLIENGADSRYEIIPLTKTEREVDKEILRTAHPDLYEQLAFIDADTAIDILGKKTLRTLILERTDLETVHRLDSVNIQPFEKLCRECGEDAALYITELRVPNGYVLREAAAAETLQAETDRKADAEAGAETKTETGIKTQTRTLTQTNTKTGGI